MEFYNEIVLEVTFQTTLQNCKIPTAQLCLQLWRVSPSLPPSHDPHLAHDALLVPLGVVEPLELEGQEVLGHQGPPRDPLADGVVGVALPGQDLLVRVAHGHLSV